MSPEEFHLRPRAAKTFRVCAENGKNPSDKQFLLRTRFYHRPTPPLDRYVSLRRKAHEGRPVTCTNPVAASA